MIYPLNPLKQSLKSGEVETIYTRKEQTMLRTHTHAYAHIRIGQQSGHQNNPQHAHMTECINGLLVFRDFTLFPL